MKDSCTLSDKSAISNCFNTLFISSVFLFEWSHRSSLPPHSTELKLILWLTPLDVTEVHRALKQQDTDKSAGPDNLEPSFLTQLQVL